MFFLGRWFNTVFVVAWLNCESFQPLNTSQVLVRLTGPWIGFSLIFFLAVRLLFVLEMIKEMFYLGLKNCQLV